MSGLRTTTPGIPSKRQALVYTSMQDYAAWSSGDPMRGSSSGGLLAAAGLDMTESETAEEQTEVPSNWQPCDAEGRAVARAGRDQ